ncbi:hypothetical protein [Sphingomonas sp. 3-13AW]|uniref:hypothetical protein n=1 Tax=Sphingomonas sp. 3-13AW TaxID=3050450 RepID=UPI003BB59B80
MQTENMQPVELDEMEIEEVAGGSGITHPNGSTGTAGTMGTMGGNDGRGGNTGVDG